MKTKSRRIFAILPCIALFAGIISADPITTSAEGDTLIAYSGHQQTYGDLSTVSDGAVLGQTGHSKRLEALTIYKGSALSELSGDIQYQAHVQGIGDTDWVGSGNQVGTVGSSKRIEAFRIRLTGEIADNYDVYYSAHIQSIGWSGWVKGIEGDDTFGGWCGTKGMSKRIEAVMIKLVPSGSESPQSEKSFTYYSSSESTYNLVYSGHQQTYGNLAAVYDGQALGNTGNAKRLEAISISLSEAASSVIGGSIQYRVHVQGTGWQTWRSDGELAGTQGQSKRIEAIEIKLTGAISEQYDVWYRVHSQSFGWMGWAKNGSSAGSTGYSKRVEAIQIKLVPKGLSAPGSTSNSFKEKKYTGKLVALTFDDGPGARCSELLDCLEKYNAHATFYVVGTNARLRSNLLNRMESIGCEIGNHTESHNTLTKLSTSQITSVLEGVNSAVRSAVGHNTATVRPPGGNYNTAVQGTVNAPIILWSIDTLDWKTRNAQSTINTVLSNVQDGDIILMHDIHTQSVDAALYLIPELQRRGYTLVTVSELAEAKGVTLQNGQVYTRIK